MDIRKFLLRYESVVESQRLQVQELRRAILDKTRPGSSELERLVSLRTIDDLWSEYLEVNRELREGIQWVSLGFGDPFAEYLRRVNASFSELLSAIDLEIPKRVEEAKDGGVDLTQRGATWTYLTTDQPFGTWSQRVLRGLIRKGKSGSVWG